MWHCFLWMLVPTSGLFRRILCIEKSISPVTNWSMISLQTMQWTVFVVSRYLLKLRGSLFFKNLQIVSISFLHDFSIVLETDPITKAHFILSDTYILYRPPWNQKQKPIILPIDISKHGALSYYWEVPNLKYGTHIVPWKI